MKSIIALILVAVGIGLIADPGIISRLSQPPTKARTATTPAPIDAPRVFAGGLVEGTQREVSLQFEITGRIIAIPVVEGQTVAAGDLLAQLDDRLLMEQQVAAQQRHQLALAERDRLVNGEREESREVVRAAARLAAVRVQRAEADKLRAEKMYARKAMAQDEYDRFRFEYDLAVAEFQRARSLVTEVEANARRDDVAIADARVRLAVSEIEQAQLMVDKCRLLAPTGGTVLRIDAEPGQIVDPEHMLSAVTMANTETMRIRAWVEELDALTVDVGLPALVVPEGRAKAAYSGTITWVAPRMGPKQYLHHQPGEHLDVHVREVLIAVPGASGLIVGHPVEVFIDPTLESTSLENEPAPDAAVSPATDAVSIPAPPRPGSAQLRPANVRPQTSATFDAPRSRQVRQ